MALPWRAGFDINSGIRDHGLFRTVSFDKCSKRAFRKTYRGNTRYDRKPVTAADLGAVGAMAVHYEGSNKA